MNRKTIILKVCNQWISLNPGLRISIRESNLPVDHITFRTHRDIYWKVEMISYQKGESKLYVRVLDYNTDDIALFEKQTPKKQVARIFFEQLKWTQLELLLATYQKAKLRYLIDARSDGGALKTAIHPEDNTDASRNLQGVPPFAGLELDSLHRKLEWHAFKPSIPVEQVTFHLGYVKAAFHFAKTDEWVDVKVENEYVIPEFDHIKFWFAKKLGVKKFRFELNIQADSKKALRCLAASEHVNAINPGLIDSVKMERCLNLVKKPGVKQPDQSLFTNEDVFDQFGAEQDEGNVFKQSDNDLLKFLMETGQVRNKKHLAYLAAKKQSQEHKLRYTLQPHFGFLFMAAGETARHFIWELLNSHATYIWSLPKSEEVHTQFKRIESAINQIRNTGRQEYRSAYQRNPLDADIVFRVIEHEKVNSALQDGFLKWKHRLNEQLT